MPAPVLQFKRGNAGVAGTVPALRPGEPAISLNNFDFFIGIDTSVANNKFFGSHRYWGREDGTNALQLKLVDKDGTNSVNLKAPDTLSGVTTYTLPATAIGYSGKILSTNEDGDLSWIDQVDILGVESIVIGIGTFTNNVAVTTTTVSTSSTTGGVVVAGGIGVGGTSYFGSDLNVGGDLNVSGITSLGSDGYLDVNSNADFAGITTFSNTEDNTLGLTNTGAVQVLGGVGIAKNLTVGAGLSVAGQSYFIGTATFYGGTINLGDSDGDNINVTGEFVSNLVPNADATYDLGQTSTPKRWRDAYFSGIGSFDSGVDAANIRIGVSDANKITTTSGNLVIDPSTGGGDVIIRTDLHVDGNVTVGGTTVTLLGEDVFIKNKDIVLGYTTSITNQDASTDTTANHGGVAIASTEGSPLCSFAGLGNTLPDTYKQLMWFQNGYLGFGTDAFAFNYGVAIGTTTMADGVRLAVGSGITMTDNTITAATFVGSVTGNVSSADKVKTVTASNTNATYYVTFVDANNGSATNETVYTDDAIQYNPGTNLLTASNLTVTETLTGTASTAIRANTVDVVGVATNQNYYVTLVDGSGISKEVGVDAELLYNPSNNTFTVGTGVGITQFSGSVSTGTSTSSVPTSSAVIDYVNAADIGLAGDTGTGSVNTTQTLTINGTTNEVETSVSGQVVTVGLPDAVVVGTSLSTPTVRTNLIKSSDTNATAITVSGTSVTIAGDLVVQGNTTQLDTKTLAVEDRTIELGKITGTQPTSTSWDLAVLFNYGDSGAKKAGLVWEASGATKRFQFTTDVNPGSDGEPNDTAAPAFTVSNFAPIEISALWVNDCAGQSQVISCTGTERFLENITVDAGTF